MQCDGEHTRGHLSKRLPASAKVLFRGPTPSSPSVAALHKGKGPTGRVVQAVESPVRRVTTVKPGPSKAGEAQEAAVRNKKVKVKLSLSAMAPSFSSSDEFSDQELADLILLVKQNSSRQLKR